MHCEMCGKEANLLRAVVEGTELRVCRQCASFGKVVGKIKPPAAKKRMEKIAEAGEEPEVIQIIVPDYAKKVKTAREKTGLKQEDAAKKLNEKESVIHKVETGHYKPSLKLARKLEKFFGINLVEEHKVEKVEKSKASSEGLTIGDLIKLKK